MNDLLDAAQNLREIKEVLIAISQSLKIACGLLFSILIISCIRAVKK